MSYILKIVRPSNIQAWVAANAPGSLKRTGRESWAAYLQSQGATGKSLSELEYSFVSSQAGKTLADKWAAKNSASSGTVCGEKQRNTYK